MAKATNPKLTATNLKSALWDTLNGIQNGTIECGEADAIASQAREILRTTKIQLQISAASQRSVPADVIAFNESA
jgi:hypothetical protein